MKPERWQRVQELFEQALALEADRRAALLDAACAGDRELREEVEALLRADGETDRFLETPEGDRMRGLVATLPGRPAPGQSIGPYRVMEEIASGGMGMVYLAVRADQQYEQRVALKVIRPGSSSEELLERFRHERQTLARLSHPHIARLLDGGATDEGLPYLVMEYIEGRPIDVFCDECALPVPERLRLFQRVCRAVHSAHQSLVIHRDLKPSNILVDAEGQPKLLDFGIAKVLQSEHEEGTDRLTRTGSRPMTLEYASPEQVRGEPVTTATDVYSLGVVLYELVAGRSPYRLERRLPHEVERAICEQDPERPSLAAPRAGRTRLPRDQAGDLDTIVLRAMDKDPRRRYASAYQLADDLHRLLRGLPVLARRDTWRYRTGKFVRRHRAAVATTVLLVLVVVASGWAVVGASLRARDAAGLATERLDQVLRISDVKRLRDYLEEADALWPAHPDRVPAMELWLEKAEPLAERRELHRRTLAGLEGGVRSEEEAWEHETLAELIGGLETFAVKETGALARMRERLAFARTVRQRSIEEHEVAWDEAFDSIADPDECPDYDGLLLEPQLGLVPLGRDHDSGLWEFAHLQTGTAPERGADGALHLTEESGLVFVLVPGGTFHMGAHPPNARYPAGAPNVDTHAYVNEIPPHEVTLGPFFLSKYEMTQAQWLHFTRGPDPCVYHPDYPDVPAPGVTRLHPVENVSWEECDRVLRQLGLALPTEAQWEYAARAGTSTPWWTGATEASLAGAINLADRAAVAGKAPWMSQLRPPDLDDGYVVHAPVDGMRPNGFGLHHALGNVWEWCADPFAFYHRVSPRAGDGLRQGTDLRRVYRGGAFTRLPSGCRCSTRFLGTPEFRSPTIGLRPARSIDP